MKRRPAVSTPDDVVSALGSGRTPVQVIADLGQPPPPEWTREQLDELAMLLRPDFTTDAHRGIDHLDRALERKRAARLSRRSA